MTYVSMEYGHWGITVSTRVAKTDYAPVVWKSFQYPVGNQGPIDSDSVEAQAIAYCKSLGGEVRGPFFK